MPIHLIVLVTTFWICSFYMSLVGCLIGCLWCLLLLLLFGRFVAFVSMRFCRFGCFWCCLIAGFWLLFRFVCVVECVGLLAVCWVYCGDLLLGD